MFLLCFLTTLLDREEYSKRFEFYKNVQSLYRFRREQGLVLYPGNAIRSHCAQWK